MAAVGPKAESRSEGQRLLAAVPGSLAKLGAAAGVSRQLVSYWKRGEKLPTPANRAKLQKAFGIDPAAWDRRPPERGKQAAATPEPRGAPARGARPSTLEET